MNLTAIGTGGRCTGSHAATRGGLIRETPAIAENVAAGRGRSRGASAWPGDMEPRGRSGGLEPSGGRQEPKVPGGPSREVGRLHPGRHPEAQTLPRPREDGGGQREASICEDPSAESSWGSSDGAQSRKARLHFRADHPGAKVLRCLSLTLSVHYECYQCNRGSSASPQGSREPNGARCLP